DSVASFVLTPLPPRSTLFPYTTLFRSVADRQVQGAAQDDQGHADGEEPGQAGAGEHVDEVGGGEQVAAVRGDGDAAEGDDAGEGQVYEGGGVESAQAHAGLRPVA